VLPALLGSVRTAHGYVRSSNPRVEETTSNKQPTSSRIPSHAHCHATADRAHPKRSDAAHSGRDQRVEDSVALSMAASSQQFSHFVVFDLPFQKDSLNTAATEDQPGIVQREPLIVLAGLITPGALATG
jgi:hypothetical protein